MTKAKRNYNVMNFLLTCRARWERRKQNTTPLGSFPEQGYSDRDSNDNRGSDLIWSSSARNCNQQEYLLSEVLLG
ncbi:hypothetical protein E2C01_081470 [Portunus trituberculatus]|uniref:Uncharacterized protein n=1 Tax=Portunus trituberculatus TaxID=210409 RepID=A0A5B7IVY9_PORTR|nr:hypothetical protein [Portunus trituberculatus]